MEVASQIFEKFGGKTPRLISFQISESEAVLGNVWSLNAFLKNLDFSLRTYTF